MIDVIKKLDLAMQVLTVVWEDTRATEIADALDMLSAWREEYVTENGQFGAGA